MACCAGVGMALVVVGCSSTPSASTDVMKASGHDIREYEVFGMT